MQLSTTWVLLSAVREKNCNTRKKSPKLVLPWQCQKGVRTTRHRFRHILQQWCFCYLTKFHWLLTFLNSFWAFLLDTMNHMLTFLDFFSGLTDVGTERRSVINRMAYAAAQLGNSSWFLTRCPGPCLKDFKVRTEPARVEKYWRTSVIWSHITVVFSRTFLWHWSFLKTGKNRKK